MAGKLPASLTSYDLLKTFAVFMMVFDHVGFFFFPQYLWLRVIGRLCVPVWFFLIGYARSRFRGKSLLFGCGILAISDLITSGQVFPINILATMLVIRSILDSLMNWTIESKVKFILTLAVLLFLILPSSLFLEYGTQGLILAMVGWFLRNCGESKYLPLFLIYAFLTFLIYQAAIFNFSQFQIYTLGIGLALVFYVLTRFESKVYKKSFWLFEAAVKFTGRRTLEIYVVHLVLFEFASLYLRSRG